MAYIPTNHDIGPELKTRALNKPRKYHCLDCALMLKAADAVAHVNAGHEVVNPWGQREPLPEPAGRSPTPESR